MRSLLVLALLLPALAQAAVHMQNPHEVIDPAIVSPSFVNTLPAAVDVTPLTLQTVSETRPALLPTLAASVTQAVSGTKPVSTTLVPQMAAPEQCLRGLRVITELALVAYDTHPNRVFMRVAANATLAEPYAANGVPPDLKGLKAAAGDMPVNGTGVREINQALQITITACAGIIKK
jgi:hypothetical protein